MARLEGSCQCGAVRFAVDSHTPTPFMRCYCSICRKTAGGGGYAINLMGEAATLTVEGGDNLSVWRAEIETDQGRETSPARRHFCALCGSALWLFDPRWPDRVYPFAGAIDSDLPAAPETVHMMLESKPGWVAVPDGPTDSHFPQYPKESIIEWHRTRGLDKD